MNIDNYLDIIINKHIDKSNLSIDDLIKPLIYNKNLDSVSYNIKYTIKNDNKDYYILNTYYFDIIKDIETDANISIIIDNREINIKNLTLPVISIKSKIYIKIYDISRKIISISYKGYILNSIPILEFLNYYNKYKIDNNCGLEIIDGKIIKS